MLPLANLATFLVPALLLIVVVLFLALRRASASRREAENAIREVKDESARKFRRF